jgi:hypothetical protein
MKFRNLGRLGLALAGAACLLAVFSASALGAGYPSNVQMWSVPGGLNYRTYEASANPNGASTTLSIQSRPVGGSEWKTLASKNIGSGTETQLFVATVAPAWLSVKEEFRAIAENSFGSTIYSAGAFGYRLDVYQSGVPGEDTASYSSGGTLKIEDYVGGGFSKIECNASGNGEFGPEAVGGAHLKLSLSGCLWYMGGSLRCNPKLTLEPMSFSAEYAVPSAEVYFRCPEEEVMHKLTYSGRFLTTIGTETRPAEFKEVEKPVTMVGSGKIDNRTATLTVSSTWALTGANAGKKFYLAEY